MTRRELGLHRYIAWLRARVAWLERELRRRRGRRAKHKAHHFDYVVEVSMDPFFEESDLSLEQSATTEERMKLKAVPKTSNDRPARIDGQVQFLAPAESGIEVQQIDETSAWLRFRNAVPGDHVVVVSADADLGEGVERIEDTALIHVANPRAASLGLLSDPSELDPDINDGGQPQPFPQGEFGPAFRPGAPGGQPQMFRATAARNPSPPGAYSGPATGYPNQPSSGPGTGNYPAQQVDPNTGRPYQGQIDPNTGRPYTGYPAGQVDPNTGQPYRGQIEPNTGQPYQGGYADQRQGGSREQRQGGRGVRRGRRGANQPSQYPPNIDPNTGQSRPGYWDPNTGQFVGQ